MARALTAAAVALVCGSLLMSATAQATRIRQGRTAHVRASPAPPSPAPPTPVQAENALPGTTAWQQHIGGTADLYATPISAAPGDQVKLHVSTPDRYRLNVYRLGWYEGTGARLVACLPACDTDEQGRLQPQQGGLQGGAAGWAVTDTLQTGADWTSGYYLVEATLAHGGVATSFFILHEAAGAAPSQILVQVPVNTWQAYNTWGGASLYSFLGPRSVAVSLARPLGFMAQSPMWWEIQTVRFLEREGYDVSYQTDTDTDTDPASLLRHRLVIVAGHDEYWSSVMRYGFDAALAGGTNLAFLGSNDAYWNVGYTDDHQTILSAKSLYDPNPVLSEKTALFREIGRPECELMGVLHQYIVPIARSLDYVVTDAGAADPWLAGAGFHAGDTIAGVVGREHDVINPYPESCFHPGLTVLFHYEGSGGDQKGDAIRFTAPSGARVFASGAQQFSWALDDWRSDGSLFPEPPVEPWRGVPVDPRVQQFMRNALDDLTRPPAPAGLTVQRLGRRVRVSVSVPADSRVRGFVAAVKVGDSWVRLCHGTSDCVGVLPKAGGVRAVGAVNVDDSRRASRAAFALLRR